jgi:hypothetical protein
MARNLMLSVGYNFAGFEDDDFAAARYTARGPYVQFRLKVDQASLEDLLRRCAAWCRDGARVLWHLF